MLQYGDHIVTATLLTSGHYHSLLLLVGEGYKFAVKTGFTSGYSGEGPKALSRILQLLLEHGAEVEEVEVDEAVLERVDASALTERDLEIIFSSKAVRPYRISDYIYDAQPCSRSLGMHWGSFPSVVPFAIIDRRIADLALNFYLDPNGTLLQGFRRLEDIIRQRTASKEHGARLLSQAFRGEGARLTWEDVQPSELVGRVNLFTGAYMAHRNPRAHQELEDSAPGLLSESFYSIIYSSLSPRRCQKIFRTNDARVTPNQSMQPTKKCGAADRLRRDVE
ncbi:Protein of unknown function (Hypoth_ymh) [Thioflavicoccus mobilis 8321]|uniref:Conserved hypothetical protein CHP02391 domain-containing protein n=2 Tax=Thioflavicoccus mobilis TaxID=80679 RepID=L0GXW9_9GAMM|nr:Protein of unknown function (Hypoth_ymh) [Thioflavicoccus mobilis 8321]